MESQLRRGAAFCRRVAVVALVVGFAGSMGVGIAFESDSVGGLSLQAVLSLMSLCILAVLLFVCLLFMVARAMDALAGLWAQGPVPAGVEAAAADAGTDASIPVVRPDETESRAVVTEPESIVPYTSATGAPDLEAHDSASPEPAYDRRPLLAEAVETIRLGDMVKVTTPDGWTGWVRDTELPAPVIACLPRTAAGVTYRPPGRSLSPGRTGAGRNA